PVAGSYSQADVRRLSASVVKLHDMPKGVLVLSGLSRVWKSRTHDPILKDSSGNVMGIHDFLCLPEWTRSKVQEEIHHDVRHTLQRLPFYYTSLAAPDVSNRTRSATVHSSRGSVRPNLFDDDYSADDESDDDDACVEIPLITPICSAATIPVGGNQSEGYVPFTAEGPSNRDSRGKAIIDDVVDTPSGISNRSQDFTSPTPASRDPTGDAIDRDFFPFAPGPYYATYPEDSVVTGSYEVSREEWDDPYQPTLSILTKEVFKD
ncbi:hypothetical protein Tco_0935299, partial [Tanacetum coccineum]